MNKIRVFYSFFAVLGGMVLTSGPAYAAAAGGGTLGEVINNIITSSASVPGLFSGLCYFFGLVLGVWAILKLRDHVESPNSVSIWDPLKKFLAGGAFFALPMMTDVVYTTVARGLAEHSETSWNGTTSGLGLDAMLVRLIESIYLPLGNMLGGFAYLAGIVLLMIGISRLLKSEQEGVRGPTGIGTIMTFLIAGALLSAETIMGAFSTSMFGSSQVATFGDLQYTAGMTGDEVNHAHAVISAVVAFVALVGWVSFLRGFFIMRSVSEGSSQASMMAGMTHLLGGALAINLGPIINAVQTTLGITEFGILFS